ncbi:mCG147891 [Mus musculus]|nr:mCG147891 [Mus musculus]
MSFPFLFPFYKWENRGSGKFRALLVYSAISLSSLSISGIHIIITVNNLCMKGLW